MLAGNYARKGFVKESEEVNVVVGWKVREKGSRERPQGLVN